MRAIGRRPNHRWPKGDLRLVREDVLRDGVHLTHAEFPVKWKWVPRLKDAHLEDVDLQCPLISGRLFSEGFVESSTFKRVSFDDVRIKGIRFEKSIFESCIFSGAIRKATFRDCRFEDCAIGRVSFNECVFEDCQITNVEMKECQLRSCRIERVTATGTLEGVTPIAECSFVDSDWSAMRIVDTAGLIRNQFERTRLPSRPDNFVLNTASLKTAYGRLDGRLSESGLSEYRRVAEIFGKQPALQFIDESWFEDLPMTDRRIVMEVLYEMRERDYEA